MLVIGHRGAAGLAPENSHEALLAGMNSGADMLEFDVRLTKDKIPVLVHDFHTFRTHREASIISRLTLAELNKRTKDKPFIPLSDVLDEFFGKILLNIEIKGIGTGRIVAGLIKRQYIHSPKDWDNVLFSSFWPNELVAVRKMSQRANLALLHAENPFLFVAFQRRLQLTAVGFHRLYANRLAVAVAKKAGMFTYAYTVNRPETALRLGQFGIDAVVTDRPDYMINELKKFVEA